MSEAKDMPSDAWWRERFPRLWPFLTSSVGTVLISSGLLGSLGALYTQNQNQRAEELKKLGFRQAEDEKTKTQLEKLDFEIGYRLMLTIAQLAELDSKAKGCTVNAKEPTVCQQTRETLRTIFSSRSQFPTLYPEFAQHSTLALVAEAKRLAPKHEQAALESVIYEMSGIQPRLEMRSEELSKPRDLAVTVLKLALPRWKRGYFYLDCNEKNPFC